jgi:8-oxo-dGTP pyrophosphatase MutT (NUDIX family)
MLRRRSSYAYTSFVRGDYSRKNLQKMLEDMTIDEKKKLMKGDFDEMWLEMTHKSYVNKDEIKKKCEKCKKRFEKLKKEYINFPMMLGCIETKRQTPEWGFPKGQKKGGGRVKIGEPQNCTEDDLKCALREFEEETKINRNKLTILNEFPLYEYFLGTDKRMYKYYYFVAIIDDDADPFLDAKDYDQVFEISEIKWVDVCEVKNMLGKITKFRNDLMVDAENLVRKHIYNLNDEFYKESYIKRMSLIPYSLGKNVKTFELFTLHLVRENILQSV